MTNALEGYAVLKVTGKGQGVDDLRKMLATRFASAKLGRSKLNARCFGVRLSSDACTADVPISVPK